MDDRDDYESAVAAGMLGRDQSGKGYIALDFFNIFWLFTIASVGGLIVETIYHMALYNGELQDRAGLLWGPFSPIYGCGAVLVTVCLNRLWKANPFLIFCASAVIGGAFEYCTSWFMEVAFGITAWDYTGRWLSIDGRTSGQFMFFWGLIGVVWIKWLLPRLLALINRIPWKVRYSLTAVWAHGRPAAGFTGRDVVQRTLQRRLHGQSLPDHAYRPFQGRAYVNGWQVITLRGQKVRRT